MRQRLPSRPALTRPCCSPPGGSSPRRGSAEWEPPTAAWITRASRTQMLLPCMPRRLHGGRPDACCIINDNPTAARLGTHLGPCCIGSRSVSADLQLARDRGSGLVRALEPPLWAEAARLRVLQPGRGCLACSLRRHLACGCRSVASCMQTASQLCSFCETLLHHCMTDVLPSIQEKAAQKALAAIWHVCRWRSAT